MNTKEMMWEEFKKKFGERVGLYSLDAPVNIDGSLKDLMNEFEEKHLLKLKKTITFTIEAPDEYHLGKAINDFEMFWADYNGFEGNCAKYSYKEK